MDIMMDKVNRNRMPEDGLSWLIEYACRLLHSYPSFTPEYVWNELPMIQGWVYVAWAIENNGWLGFCGVKRNGAGFIKQYADALYKQAKDAMTEGK